MAASVAAAFAEVAGPVLDEIVYSPRPVPRTKPHWAVERFDYGRFREVAVQRLMRRCHCERSDAEDAVHEAFVHLLERHRALLRRDPETWAGLFHSRAYFRLMRMREQGLRCAPSDALEDILAASPDLPGLGGEEDARYEPPPAPGRSWSRRQVLGAFQRYRDRHGKPPRVRDCGPANRLPSYASVRRHFASFDAAVLAAGMVPGELGRRRRPWEPVEAASACRWFKRRHGHWPGSGDLRRHADVLPSRSAMERCFGSTNPAQVRLVAEAILRDAGL